MIKETLMFLHNWADYDQKNQIVAKDNYGNNINLDNLIIIGLGFALIIAFAIILWALFAHMGQAYCNTEWYHG